MIGLVPTWAKLAALALLFAGGMAAGSLARGRWDAGELATAQADAKQANLDAQRAEAERDGWKRAADAWSGAIDAQNAANVKAQEAAKKDQVLAIRAIDAATAAEHDYRKRLAAINARAKADATGPCAAELARPVCGAPLE